MKIRVGWLIELTLLGGLVVANVSFGQDWDHVEVCIYSPVQGLDDYLLYTVQVYVPEIRIKTVIVNWADIDRYFSNSAPFDLFVLPLDLLADYVVAGYLMPFERVDPIKFKFSTPFWIDGQLFGIPIPVTGYALAMPRWARNREAVSYVAEVIYDILIPQCFSNTVALDGTGFDHTASRVREFPVHGRLCIAYTDIYGRMGLALEIYDGISFMSSVYSFTVDTTHNPAGPDIKGLNISAYPQTFVSGRIDESHHRAEIRVAAYWGDVLYSLTGDWEGVTDFLRNAREREATIAPRDGQHAVEIPEHIPEACIMDSFGLMEVTEGEKIRYGLVEEVYFNKEQAAPEEAAFLMLYCNNVNYTVHWSSSAAADIKAHLQFYNKDNRATSGPDRDIITYEIDTHGSGKEEPDTPLLGADGVWVYPEDIRRLWTRDIRMNEAIIPNIARSLV